MLGRPLVAGMPAVAGFLEGAASASPAVCASLPLTALVRTPPVVLNSPISVALAAQCVATAVRRPEFRKAEGLKGGLKLGPGQLWNLMGSRSQLWRRPTSPPYALLPLLSS